MPTVRFQGRATICKPGTALRDALLDAGMTPHHTAVSILNCHGLGTCGTCAVQVDGAADATSPPTARERWRLGLPPHRRDAGLRLACQCRINGDVEVRKHRGVWGQGAPDAGASESGIR
ncbi:MAG: 2Fe-2S iron-sulfur cluster binding domain-containing protein [Planctomycetia bacterium]|nr:2Fe-2S iron-sulfur cluster binding domain-containing protein [Planctomycetia bacterium]